MKYNHYHYILTFTHLLLFFLYIYYCWLKSIFPEIQLLFIHIPYIIWLLGMCLAKRLHNMKIIERNSKQSRIILCIFYACSMTFHWLFLLKVQRNKKKRKIKKKSLAETLMLMPCTNLTAIEVLAVPCLPFKSGRWQCSSYPNITGHGESDYVS